ncbi:MAG TPA: HAD family phosphatase [Actinocrinis sp.]|uniref:HAD family hydrolase n=1 Tax=Actinocrinis sp. TaxID=1920516 RepID=UPI002DDDAA78|nr:HAD family phosphatase [Actinocrinis sp.]HEV2347908.1 HAD family phosphatase [Actinocrinis sp.]
MTSPDTIQRFIADMLAQAGGLIVDYDGTFADTGPARQTALTRALALHGSQLDPAWYRARTGLSIGDLLGELPDASHLDHDAIIAASRSQLLGCLDRIEPVPSVLHLVRLAVEHGIPCAIASGTSGALVHPGLDALGHTGLFAAVLVREDVAQGKPAPDLFLAAADRIGVPAARCLAVDDAPQGIEAAQRAGMAVLTLDSGLLARVPDDAARVVEGCDS